MERSVEKEGSKRKGKRFVLPSAPVKHTYTVKRSSHVFDPESLSLSGCVSRQTNAIAISPVFPVLSACFLPLQPAMEATDKVC